MEVLQKGTIQSLLVVLRDRLGLLDDLNDTTGLVFDTKLKYELTPVQTGALVALQPTHPMTAICEIDTTLAGYEAGKEYGLYIRYTAGSESPILGPQFFRVEND